MPWGCHRRSHEDVAQPAQVVFEPPSSPRTPQLHSAELGEAINDTQKVLALEQDLARVKEELAEAKKLHAAEVAAVHLRELRKIRAEANAQARQTNLHTAHDHEWNSADFLLNLGMHKTLAAILNEPDAPGANQLEQLRAIGAHTDGKAMVRALLFDGLETMVDALWQGLQELLQKRAATASELVEKFVSEDSAFVMNLGGLNTYFKGLEGLIGPPSPNFDDALRAEHCVAVDSNVKFITSNYSVTTTSHVEWLFVVDPLDGLAIIGGACEKNAVGSWPCWPEEQKLLDIQRKDLARKPRSLNKLRNQRKEVNISLVKADCAPLVDAEMIAGRLYT